MKGERITVGLACFLMAAGLTLNICADGFREPFVAGEVSASFVNKVLSYGLVDGDEPLFLPSGSLTFFGWYSAG